MRPLWQLFVTRHKPTQICNPLVFKNQETSSCGNLIHDIQRYAKTGQARSMGHYSLRMHHRELYVIWGIFLEVGYSVEPF